MTSDSENLFYSLSTWTSGQDENFLTESFARTLEALRDDAPEFFVAFVSWASQAEVVPDVHALPMTSLTTQYQADVSNYPDLVVEGPNFHVWFEIKDRSPLDTEQLQRYSAKLSEIDVESKALVFLSRETPDLPSIPYLKKSLSWTMVAEWTENDGLDDLDGSPVAEYLLDEFQGFLRGKNMTVDRVGWELQPGVEALLDLRTMMGEALQTVIPGKLTKAGNHYVTGFTAAGSDGKAALNFFVEFNYPQWLQLTVRDDHLSKSAKKQWLEHRSWGFRAELDLSDEDVYFFARERESQRRTILEFLNEWLPTTKWKLRKPGQAAAIVENDADDSEASGRGSKAK